MFLCLELPGIDKGVTIFVHDLCGEKEHESRDDFVYAQERSRANRAINVASIALGTPHLPACRLFNQFCFPGTSGWEHWCENTRKDRAIVIKHALLVSAMLGVPLHVHINVMDAMMDAAIDSEVAFDFRLAQPVEKPSFRGFHFINDQIRSGEYFELTEIKLPASMPSVPEL